MKKNIFLLAAAAIGFVSCQKSVDYGKLSSNFIVSTNVAQGVAFNHFKTYYISDTVSNLGGTGEDSIIVGGIATTLVNQVVTNMNARGYTLVGPRQFPDLGMRMGVVKVTTINYYPGWWGGYPGWGWGWWGGYYPPYYGWSTVYSYTTGTLVLDMYNLKDARQTHEYVCVWNTTDFGALGSSTTTNTGLATKALDQAFIQSPYINAQ